MAHAKQLRASFERCLARRNDCARQLADFAKSADLSDLRQDRCFQKLKSDLQRAENDIYILQKQLDDLME